MWKLFRNPLEEPYGVISHNGGSAKHQFTSVLFHDFASDLSRNAVSLSQSRSIQSVSVNTFLNDSK